MEKRLLFFGLFSLCGAACAADTMETAQVISASPIYENVTQPRRECSMETVQAAPREYPIGGMVVGGVVGGVAGSQAGGGSAVATGVGTVAGAVIGDRMANPNINRSVTGAVVGGAAGALLGNQVGGGSTAATIAGGVAGTIVGERLINPDQPNTERVERCHETQMTREVIKGYRVIYRHNGRDMETILPYEPGPVIWVGPDGRVEQQR